MKAGIAALLVLCFFAVAFAAEQAVEDGSIARRLMSGGYDIVDCVPKEKYCPTGYYCVYYPEKKCKIEKECVDEEVKVCVKYQYVYSHYNTYGHGGGKTKKCVHYGTKIVKKCEDKKVCFEYICSKVCH